MECHDAKLLLTFAQRQCEGIDASERAALDRHLGACPDCAAFANAERIADATFAKVMLDVPVPTDLQEKLIQRLSAQRPVRPWKWVAVAATILIAATGIGVWYTQPTDVTIVHLIEFVEFVEPFVGMKPADVEEHFADQGVHLKAPVEFDYDYLRHAEVIKFRNQRIGKLLFRRELSNGVIAQAYVLVLPHGQFRVDQIPEGQLNHATTIEVKHVGDFTYVIYHRGNLSALLRRNSAA